MKKFSIQIVVFLIFVLASIVIVLWNAGGHADSYYLKFTTNKQSNLILGSSKAAQGIQPTELHNVLGLRLYNYAFSNMVSPYGPVYFKSIQNKLDNSTKNGIFIITIDPWSICSISSHPNDSSTFREINSCTDIVKNVSQYPNFTYLTKSFDGNYFDILLKRGPAEVMNDGWLNVSLNDDKENVLRRTEFTLKGYQEKVSEYKFSLLRLNYLTKTIKYLSTYGEVHLVRLPIHSELMHIESLLMPNFDTTIQNAILNSDSYLDMTNQNTLYTFTDGVHLTHSSSAVVSQKIGLWIEEKMKD